MKFFKLGLLIAATTLAFFSCQKELKFDDNGVSAGALKKDASGNCSPVTVTGIFKVDSTLNNTQFVDVQINATTPGTFDIRTDTVNGYSFSKVGSVVFGPNTIRLYPNGKPIAPGKNTFTVKYGTSTCSFDITAVDPNIGNAVFTLGGAGGACTNASVGGTYTSGVALTPSNTLTITVDVTTTGTYNIGAASTNGLIFTGSGVFTSTGAQNVTLTGSGMPLTAGTSVVTVLTVTGSTCTYPITVQAGSGGGGGGGGGGGSGGSSQYYFQFNVGTTLIAADTGAVVSLSIPLGGMVSLSVQAPSVTADTALQLAVTTTGNPQTGVTYKTSNLAVPTGLFSVISASTGQIYQADASTAILNANNIDIKFDVIDTVNKIVSGTFSGTASTATGSNVTITNGKFRAQMQ